MKFNPGDRVKIACEVVGVILNDPVRSEHSIIVDFNGQLARLPNDGTLLGLNCVKLVKIEEEENG